MIHLPLTIVQCVICFMKGPKDLSYSQPDTLSWRTRSKAPVKLSSSQDRLNHAFRAQNNPNLFLMACAHTKFLRKHMRFCFHPKIIVTDVFPNICPLMHLDMMRLIVISHHGHWTFLADDCRNWSNISELCKYIHGTYVAMLSLVFFVHFIVGSLRYVQSDCVLLPERLPMGKM